MRPKRLSPTRYSILALTVLALVFATNAAATEKVIHNLITYPHGASPIGNLIVDAAGNLYGTAFNGGDHGYGAVFRLTRKPNGKWVETILHSFEGPISTEGGTKDGWSPNGGLTFDTSGNLYGTTYLGGEQACQCGTVFELAPVGGDRFSYMTIYRFKGKNDGAYPSSAVVVDAAGNFYGTTSGVDLVNGAVFELARSSKGWTAKTIYTFAAEHPGNLAIDAVGKLYGTGAGIFQLTRGRDGKWTENSLCAGCSSTGIPVFDQAGNLYVGTMNQVLELVRKENWKMTVIATFTATEGSYALGALTFDESGNLYGTNGSGGEVNACNYSGCGTAFELTHKKDGEWQVSVLYTFKGNRDGAGPAGIIFDRHGNLYGATGVGGDPLCDVNSNIPGCGTVFELAPASGGHWKFDVIDRFGLGDGSGPPSGLVVDASGNLYGTMPQGASSDGGGCGIVYELTPSPHAGWKERILHQFKCGTSDGTYPASSLIFDPAGNLYGTTSWGGTTGGGTVFELKPTASGAWTESVIYSFTGNADGYEPSGAVVFDAAGNLYGVTDYGGGGQCQTEYSFGCGVLYELSLASQGTWTETTLHTFMGYPNDGAYPVGALGVDQAGDIFGTTIQGGNGACVVRDGCGTVFELSPGSGGVWTETVIYNFPGLPGLTAPEGGLTLDSHGNLYGAAAGGNGNGCPYGCGAVYELSPSSGGNWTATVLYNFGAFKGDGQYPVGTLTFDATGNLDGATAEGGTPGCGIGISGCGTMFRLSPSGGGWTESVLYSFSGPYKDGAFPATGVILDAAGDVYGTTNNGGADQGYYTVGGTVFEISP
ncbi:MAG: choice-of-anchor tandem repeat GloVer-containing protein [Terriglobales bacterium]|jgi:uncharacterized repeat protein (TIGR03803 family)